MTLTGKAADDFINSLRAKNEQEERRNLAEAKDEAQFRGKEPFDLEKLEQLCDTSTEGRVDPVESRQKRFEVMYYISHPEFMTLRELADLVTLLSQWS